MNIASCAAKLLTYFSPEERSIPDNATYPGRNAAVLEALNSALQDLFGKGKPWVRSDERGAVLNAPVTIPIAVTQGSTSATIDPGDWQTWFAGCTIIIDGAAVDNQIRNATSAVILKFPYSGATGSHSATIYHDSIEIGTDVLEVHDPVRLDRRPLTLRSLATPEQTPRNIEDFGFHRQAASITCQSIADTAGTPYAYELETWSPDAVTAPKLRMRFFPAPLQTGFVDFPVMLTPPRITSIASIDALPIPFSFVESIFLPIATKKLRSCPFWRGMVGDDDVNSAYTNALDLLNDGNPAKTTGFQFKTSF